MKLECDPERFFADPEGVQLAERINASLPREVGSVCGWKGSPKGRLCAGMQLHACVLATCETGPANPCRHPLLLPDPLQ